MAKILVVDDDPDIVEATQLFLAREGHQIEVAYNRQDGLKKVASQA
jgi:CheY-like chemotaxis protein